MVIGSSNESVNIPARKVLAESKKRGTSTDRFYRVFPDSYGYLYLEAADAPDTDVEMIEDGEPA